ncbi:MAG: sugar phosphate isomerase/epimerase family protein [Rubripirellula sp.]
MLPGYHTAGLLQHDIVVALEELATIGYRSVAVRPRSGMLAPREDGFGRQVLRVADAISRARLHLVLDLDGHFIDDPWSRRGPSLAAADPSEVERARGSVEAWLEIAGELSAPLITFSSGCSSAQELAPDESVLERIAGQIDPLVEAAARKDVRLALRPQHGDAISTVAQFERLQQWLETDELLLAADIGEMLLGHEMPVADRLARNMDVLACVYLCDRKGGQTTDQPIGRGDVAHQRILQALEKESFSGPVIVRVEGHSELGFTPAAEAIPIFGSA